MWIQIRARTSLPRDIYIAVCYFPPISSSYAIHNSSDGDPFTDLYSDITRFLIVGDVILTGDFNARTKDLQTPMHDRLEDIFCTRGIDPITVGMHRTSEDHLGLTTTYGKYLLQLGESHGLVILNSLPCFPSSHFFTCRPFGGGTSVVDYAIANPNILPYIKNFSVTPIPLADHALLSFSL